MQRTSRFSFGFKTAIECSEALLSLFERLRVAFAERKDLRVALDLLKRLNPLCLLQRAGKVS